MNVKTLTQHDVLNIAHVSPILVPIEWVNLDLCCADQSGYYYRSGAYDYTLPNGTTGVGFMTSWGDFVQVDDDGSVTWNDKGNTLGCHGIDVPWLQVDSSSFQNL